MSITRPVVPRESLARYGPLDGLAAGPVTREDLLTVARIAWVVKCDDDIYPNDERDAAGKLWFLVLDLLHR